VEIPSSHVPRDNSVERELDAEVRGPCEAASARAPFRGVSFDEVYEHHFEFVWRSLRMLGVSQGSLDDAVQDVFNTVVRQLPCFEGRSSLRTWVFGIAQFTAANHRRAERRKSAPLAPLDDGLASSEPSPHEHAEARQLAELVLRFCEELDEGRRAVFVLGLLEDVPAAEIAELLQIPVNTVYSRVRTLKNALRERLEQHEVRQ
jgi:RNA polymerase sigma-70 factor (ECF subfamily)